MAILKSKLSINPAIINLLNKVAVSSSTRLLRLKLNTVNKNGNSFRNAWGSEAANAGKYRGSYNSPFFIKSKNNVCRAADFHRNGNHSICFGTQSHIRDTSKSQF